jgi:molybdopterin-containing oxidoreductase family membrane subunit
VANQEHSTEAESGKQIPVHGGDGYHDEPRLVTGNLSFSEITDMVARHNERDTTPLPWKILFGVATLGSLLLLAMVAYQIWNGVGVWGNNQPVAWGWPIVNFVWWVGIGHAGTLISAILFLFRQHWRTSINRSAEAMTLFAVMCAGLFPAIHVGRIWVVYWMFPVPNQMEMWPQFKSPLLWDVFAVSSYFTVSLLFWYVGLIPDLATLRDRAKGLRAKILGFFSMGWTGANRHWRNYEKSYLLLAALATPLVLSVHSVVSFDFAVSILPGWHTTIFPPYFVTGAIFSGFAMVVTLLVIARKAYGIEDLITINHLEKMNIIILVTGTIVGFAYITEFFMAWYSGVEYEQFAFINRAFGPYAWAYWIMMTCNLITPQLFWFKKIRRSIPAMFVLSIIVNIGMWYERFVIVTTSLHRDFLPSSWGYFEGTWIDVFTYVGTMGFFLFMFLLFLRYVPMVAIAEVKGVLPEADPHHYEESDGHHGSDVPYVQPAEEQSDQGSSSDQS